MDGTLSIQGDLVTLGKLAVKIEKWFPGALATEVRAAGWGGWTVDSMAALLERLHPWQLLLVSFVARAGGRRVDPEVRDKFSLGDSGLRGQTGPISKHIMNMKAEGVIPDDATYVLKIDRTTKVRTFITPDKLMPILRAALSRPSVEQALDSARVSQKLDERE